MKQNIIIFSQNRNNAASRFFFLEENSLPFLSIQYRGCWWLGDAWSQGNSSHGVDLFLSGYSGHSTRRVKVLTWVPASTLIYMYNMFSRFSSESTLMLPIWHNGICLTYVNYGVTTMNTSVMLVLISWPDDLRDGSHAEPSKVKTTPCDLITYSYQAAKVYNNIAHQRDKFIAWVQITFMWMAGCQYDGCKYW